MMRSEEISKIANGGKVQIMLEMKSVVEKSCQNGKGGKV